MKSYERLRDLFHPGTSSTPNIFHPELLPLWDIFHPETFFTLGPAVAKGWGGKSSGWIRSKSSGWKRSGVENVQVGTCPRVEKVPEPLCRILNNIQKGVKIVLSYRIGLTGLYPLRVVNPEMWSNYMCIKDIKWCADLNLALQRCPGHGCRWKSLLPNRCFALGIIFNFDLKAILFIISQSFQSFWSLLPIGDSRRNLLTWSTVHCGAGMRNICFL